MYNTTSAVLLLFFNRKESAIAVMRQIAKVRPKRVFLSCDGARNDAELEKVIDIRDALEKMINWDCVVLTNYFNENLGCRNAVSNGITWFFNNVEEGIILEDDCVPSISFFRFCDELLNEYRSDLRIWNIGGYCPPYIEKPNDSYSFSLFTHIWGWASWSNRWKYYDSNIKNLDLYLSFKSDLFPFKKLNRNRMSLLQDVKADLVDTWDYQWNFTIRSNNGLSVRPCVNLVENIGFGSDSTHTKNDSSVHNGNKYKEMNFPLVKPNFVVPNIGQDKIHAKRLVRKSLFRRFIQKFISTVWN
jgi:hypothetical protein